MTDYLTVAEVYRIQHRLIEMFGGLHGVRDKGAVEAAVFRPQTGCYNSIEEEAAALMAAREKAGTLPDRLDQMVRGYMPSRCLLTALELDSADVQETAQEE